MFCYLPNQLDKLKKVTFCTLKTLLGRNFVHNLKTFRGFCQEHVYDFVANIIQHENHFLPTSKHCQAKVLRHFLSASSPPSPFSPTHCMMGRGDNSTCPLHLIHLKSAQIIPLLVLGSNLVGQHENRGRGGGGEGVRASWQGGTPKLVPVIFDAFIRKAHHTAGFSLTFAFLRLTCCAHLSHWLNDSHDQ